MSSALKIKFHLYSTAASGAEGLSELDTMPIEGKAICREVESMASKVQESLAEDSAE